MVHADSTGTGRIWVLHVGPQPWPRNGTFASDSIYTVIPTCKAKRQYLLTLQASKYYLLALKNSKLGLYLIRVHCVVWHERRAISGIQRDVEPMLVWCWASVADAGPVSNQHWFYVSCLRGWFFNPHMSQTPTPFICYQKTDTLQPGEWASW